MSTALTVQQFESALPPHMRKNVDPALVGVINNMLADPDKGEAYRDNLIGYTSVLKDGKFKLESYVNAIRFVTHKIMGKNDLEAYSATFPDKIADWQSRGVSSKDMSSYISMYKKGKLPTLITEQSMVPCWLMNQDWRQKAIDQLGNLMMTATSEKVQADAAIGLLTHLKMPEKVKIELDVGEKTTGVMEGLRQQTMQLVEQQRAMLAAGLTNAKDVAESKLIIDQDVTDV